MATVLGVLVSVTAVAAGEQFIPVLSVREGALRDAQTVTDGFIAYLTLLNERDGGINGVTLVWEECDTVYDVERGVKCYERLKGKGPTGAAAFVSLGTPLAYALTERATHDQIPLLDAQAAQYGFAVQHLAVKPPGLDQKATWLRVKVAQPDWVILRAQGVMIPPALKEAAQIGFPRDKMVGPFSTCGEQEIVAAGEAAMGFICGIWYGTGAHFPLIQEIRTYVYGRGRGPGPESDVGTTHWNRGVLRAVLVTETIRTAMRHFGNQPLTGAQVQWGLDHLTLTPAYLEGAGGGGLTSPAHPLLP